MMDGRVGESRGLIDYCALWRPSSSDRASFSRMCYRCCVGGSCKHSPDGRL